MNKKTVILILGKSGCGKSTLERGLVTQEGFKKVVSVTTRPMRTGEVDGIDYHFVTNTKFDEIVESGDVIQYTEFAGNRYASTKREYATPHRYVTIVIIPSSAATLIPALNAMGIDTKVIYFDISDQLLRTNMAKRGDSDDDITTRLAKDDLDAQFKHHNLEADFIIQDHELNEHTLNSVLVWLKETQ